MKAVVIPNKAFDAILHCAETVALPEAREALFDSVCPRIEFNVDEINAAKESEKQGNNSGSRCKKPKQKRRNEPMIVPKLSFSATG